VRRGVLPALAVTAGIVSLLLLGGQWGARGQGAVDEVSRAADFSRQAVEDPDRAHEFARDETPDVTDLSVLRTFRYPGGRIWVVCVMQDPGTSPSVLRFTAGSRNIDLADWPKDWPDYSDDQLVELLRRAAPRAKGAAPSPNAPRRRWDDEANP